MYPIPAEAPGKSKRGLIIAAVVAFVLIVAGAGVGIGLGLTSGKSKSSKSSPAPTPTSQLTPGPGSTSTPANGSSPAAPSSPTIAASPSPPKGEPLNQTELPLAAVEEFMAYINKTAQETVDPVNRQDLLDVVEILEDNGYVFLLFLRSQKLDSVINFLQDAVLNETGKATFQSNLELQASFNDILNFRDFRDWLDAGARDVPKLTPTQLKDLRGLEVHLDAQIVEKYGDNPPSPPGAGDPDPRDPVVQLRAFEARLRAAGVTFQNFLTIPASTSKVAAAGRKLQAGAAGRLPPLGNAWFEPLEIGIVFHVLQFVYQTTLVPGEFAKTSAAFESMVAIVNRYYYLSGANIQFKIVELRQDPVEYDYLLVDQDKWQSCATDGFKCFCDLASDYNDEPSKHINVWLSGSFSFGGFKDAVLGYTTSLPPIIDVCGQAADPFDIAAADDQSTNPVPYNNVTTPKTQHIWMIADAIPLRTRAAGNASYSDSDIGPMTLAHELGHYLGLSHTHDDDCVAVDSVLDTPPNKLIDSQPWAQKGLKGWCKALRAGKRQAEAKLKAFDSCRDDAYIDNVFNVMSYSPAACNLYFTPGQVDRMQKITTVYHPGMRS